MLVKLAQPEMKIACITTSRIPSNTANSIQAMKVCQALQQTGNQVQLWVPHFQKAKWSYIADIYGLTEKFQLNWLPFFPPFRQYDFCRKAVKFAQQWDADLIYTWALQAAVVGVLTKNPIVMEFHDYPMGTFGPYLFHIFMRRPGVKLLLFTTKALATGLEKRYGISISEKNLQIAPNGTEIERYHDLPNPSQARKTIGIKDKLSIVFTGHFYQGRGAELLLELANSLPNLQFLWIGGNEADVQPWRERLQQLGIQNVIITGFVPNSQIPLYQAAGEILLMPYGKKISGSSGGDISDVINPMKMFDYLAAGRAIIASNIPVFREILNKDNAVFCEPDKPSNWIDAVKTLAIDEALRKRLGEQAKSDAQQYTWKKRAKKTLEKYQLLIKEMPK